MASIVDPPPDSKSYHSDRWRSVVVDEGDFRLACHLVRNWRDTSDGTDPELIDRIAAAVQFIRTGGAA